MTHNPDGKAESPQSLSLLGIKIEEDYRVPKGELWFVDKDGRLKHVVKVEPMSYFQQVIEDILAMHAKKAKDYTSSNREFGNFEDSAKHAGITTQQAIENLIGTKEARRQNLENIVVTEPINESIEDTLLDRAVYCIIRLAHYRSLKEANTLGKKHLEDMPRPKTNIP